MANRLSTAEILAAARAADGSGAGGRKLAAPGVGRSSRAERPDSSSSVAVLEREDSTEDFEEQAALEEIPPANENGKVVASTPPSVSKLIAAARGDAREGSRSSKAPPSMAAILADLRKETSPALPTPPSMARILADVRGGSAVTPVKETTSKDKAASDSRDSKTDTSRSTTGRGSTASILAAARKQGGAGGGKPSVKQPANPAGEKPSGTASILAAARKQGGAKSGKPPAKTSASPVGEKPSGTAAILAAARKQGRAGTTATASSSKKAIKQPPRDVSEKIREARSTAGDADHADGRPRPARIAEILATVRCENPAELALSELPSLVEMMASLRRLSEEQSARRREVRSTAMPWRERVRQWFAGKRHRIAVRQFDHS